MDVAIPQDRETRLPRRHRLAARHRRAGGGGVSFRDAGDVRRLCRRRHLLRHLRLSDHRHHPAGIAGRQFFLCAVLRAAGAAAVAGAICDGGADGDPVVPLSAGLRTHGILPLRRCRRHLHLKLLLLAPDRLFRPCGGGKAAAAYLVAGGRGAVLSGAAAAAVGDWRGLRAAGARRCRCCSSCSRLRPLRSASG